MYSVPYRKLLLSTHQNVNPIEAMAKERIWVERAVKLKPSRIIKNDYNPNETTEVVNKAIKESVDYFGQVQELVVRPDPEQSDRYIIIDGEHRWKLSGEEFLFANVIHGLTEAEAKKLTLILSETQGSITKVNISRLLSDIQDDFDDQEFAIGLPYKPVELSELVGMGSLDWDNYGDGDKYQVASLSDEANDRVFNTHDTDNKQFQKELKQTTTSTIKRNTHTTTTNHPDPTVPTEITSLKISLEEKDLFLQAKDLVSQEIELDENVMIANGQFIMKLVKDYLIR